MKTFSLPLLARTVTEKRRALGIKQAELAALTGMNRSMLSRLENGSFTPSVDQLEKLGAALGFDPASLFVEEPAPATPAAADSEAPRLNIAVAGIGYVGLSLAVLLAQHHHVTAVCTKQEKADNLNRYISPIQDEYIDRYLAEAKAGARPLDLTATTDGASAYRAADFVIVAVPTNYDPKT
ncbi:MAG: XRE family transcriptional regulator, partial [Oscillospiraceae bacterium]|nr:XRE family transcriptional regulator [Oscillospiraceae bacterium]